MIIYKEDSEEERESKRRANIIEMSKDHQRGALCLPLGIPLRCKVEQPREHIRPEWDYIQGVACWISNGEVRQVVFNGVGGKSYARRWAGNARGDSIGRGKPNTGEYPQDFDPGDCAYHAFSEIESNDTSYIQAARAKKGKGVTGKRGGKRLGAGRKTIKAPN